MKKLYNEFFRVPKDGKIGEKVMLARIATSIAVVVTCLIAMSFTAYAYFAYNVTSESHVITAAHFETKIAVISEENGVKTDHNAASTNYQKQSVVLEPGKPYTVEVEPGRDNPAKTGFLVITADGCKETYHTQQIGTDTGVSGGRTERISFTLSVTQQTTVHFLAHWGTSSQYNDYKNQGDALYVIQGESVEMVINGSPASSVSEDEEEKIESSESTPSTVPPVTTTAPPPTTTVPPTPSTSNSEEKPSAEAESSDDKDKDGSTQSGSDLSEQSDTSTDSPAAVASDETSGS